jgi:hypothetical protein
VAIATLASCNNYDLLDKLENPGDRERTNAGSAYMFFR